MKVNPTRLVLSEEKKIKEVSPEKVSPKQSTLNILKQFARTYNCEKRLPKGLQSFVAN